MTDPARSPLLARRSLALRFERFGVPLTQAKATGAKLGGSVNDVYVTGVTGALGLYHERMGVPVDELRMAMPISTRGDDEDSREQLRADACTRAGHTQGPGGALQARARTTARPARRAGASPPPTRLRACSPPCRPRCSSRSRARKPTRSTSQHRTCRAAPSTCTSGAPGSKRNYPMGPRAACALNVTLLSLPRLARHGDQHRSRRRERPGDDARLHRGVVRRPSRRLAKPPAAQGAGRRTLGTSSIASHHSVKPGSSHSSCSHSVTRSST